MVVIKRLLFFIVAAWKKLENHIQKHLKTWRTKTAAFTNIYLYKKIAQSI